MAELADSFRRGCSLNAESLIVSLVDSIPYPLVIRDMERTVVLANGAANAYFGSDLVGLKCHQAQRNKACPCDDCPTLEVAASGIPARRELQHPQTRDHLEINVYPMLNQSGEICGFIETTETVNAAHEAMEKVRTLLREVSVRNKELTEWRKSLDADLNVARQIQQALVPQHGLQAGGLSLNFVYRPSGTVGGDLYDIFRLDENRLGVLIADASGHGVAAAFIAVLMKMLFLSSGTNRNSPHRALETLNRELLRIVPTGQFATAFYGVYNALSGRLTFTRAGHPMPLLLRRHTRRIEQLDTDGFVLGAMEGVTFEERSIEMFPGDAILLYTDGVVEAMNEHGARFGVHRLENAFRKHTSGDGDAVLNHILDSVREYTRGQPLRDDLTLILGEVVEAERMPAEAAEI